MSARNPAATGVALSLTFIISYTVCAALYALSPERGIDFLNAMFHGLDFHKLGTPMAFTFLMFLYPLIVFAIWGFAAGTLFAWLRSLVQRAAGER